MLARAAHDVPTASRSVKLAWLLSTPVFSAIFSGSGVRPRILWCSALPDYEKLRTALVAAVKEDPAGNGGLGTRAAVVDRDGIACAAVFSRPEHGAPWPGSRIGAAERPAPPLIQTNYALSTKLSLGDAQPGGTC